MNQELLLISIYCMVDDFCAQPQVALQLCRPGRKPKLSDVSLLSLSLLQEFTGIHDEDDYWRHVRKIFASYFPGQLIDRSQYNRRKKNLTALINQFRAQIVKRAPIPEPYTGYHVIDAVGTTAITVTKFFGSHSFPNAGLGYCASKQLHYAGYKTTTIVSLTGAIEDFVIGSAAPHDAPYGEALLSTQLPGVYLGDKGYILKEEERAKLVQQGVTLVTHQRSNMTQTTTKEERWLLKKFRRVVETSNAQLTELFNYNRPGGKSERGVLSRLNYKLAAHTVGLVLLRQFGLPPTKLDLLTGMV